MNERKTALAVVTGVMERQCFLKSEYETVVARNRSLTAQQIAYIRRVSHGVVERCIELDFRIQAFSKTKLRRMHPAVRNLLRLGAYEIGYMDAIPPSATVNEMVRLAKQSGQARAAGLVNAVLRRLAETWSQEADGGAAAPGGVPAGSEDALTGTGGGLTASDGLAGTSGTADAATLTRQLSISYSLPEWIVAAWLKRYGPARTTGMLTAFLAESVPTVRLDRTKVTPETWVHRAQDAGAIVEVVDWREVLPAGTTGLPAAYRVRRLAGIEQLPGFAEGQFYVQDPSAMLVCACAGLRPGDRVLDVCASPGGKAVQAAELVGADGHVEARDISEGKVRRITANIARSGHANLTARVWDACERDVDAVAQYDVVLADVPCSGLGVLGRKPEIKYRLTPEDIDALSAKQAAILRTVCDYVRPGGRLVYSTCTISEAENERQTAAFLAARPAFQRLHEKQILPMPGWDGFYLCVMKRNQ